MTMTPTSSGCYSVYGSGSVQPQQPNDNNLTQRRKRERIESIHRLHIPMWLLRLASEFELFRSRSGWTFNIRTFNYISRGSLICKAVVNQDVETIKDLFRTGKALVYDIVVDDDGWRQTLIEVSFQYHFNP